MNSLNSDPATLFRTLFLVQLPVEGRRVSAFNTTASIADLADEADRIMAAGNLPSAVGAIGTTVSEPSSLATTTIAVVSVVPRHGPHGSPHNPRRQRRNRNGRSLADARLDDNGFVLMLTPSTVSRMSLREIHSSPTVSGSAKADSR